VHGDNAFALAFSLAASRLRIDSLASSWMRCARWTRLSKIASAGVGSPSTAENPQTGTSDIYDQGDGADPSLVWKDTEAVI
jgi:hypothetical protein